jgi:predicted RNA binding protein YcfA (HicA-like mRNA interferase family)
MRSSQVIEALRAAGFKLDRIRGSHHVFTRGGATVVVPHPKKDLPMGTVKSIERQSGVKVR